MALMMPVMMLILNVLSVVILWVGAHQVAQANMQVGDMMAFLQYAMQIVFSFLMMSFLFIILPRAAVSADRIADVLETEPIITDPVSPCGSTEPSAAPSSSATSPSAIPAPTRTCCTASALSPGRARRPPLSARPAPANRPSST
jgi:ABC-type multidrug transport system fused ATPase/permease subunit